MIDVPLRPGCHYVPTYTKQCAVFICGFCTFSTKLRSSRESETLTDVSISKNSLNTSNIDSVFRLLPENASFPISDGSIHACSLDPKLLP